MSNDQGNRIIEVENVSKWYGDFKALGNVSLNVKSGEKIVICGPSGSGKSTLIRCLNRLEAHQDGIIKVDAGFAIPIFMSPKAGSESCR